MDQWLNTLNTWLAANPSWIALAIAGTALLESLAVAGLVVPGVAMLFVIAAAAGHHDLSIWAAMGWACLGAIAGDGISFWIGRHFKGRIYSIWPFSRHPRTLLQAERFFQRHGGKSVVLGRFIGPVRPIVPMVAGAFEMPAKRFLLFNILSALGWAPVYVLPGFLVGASMALEPDLPRHFYPVLIASVLVLAAGLTLFFRVHVELLPEGKLYNAARRLMQRHSATRHLWHGLISPRGKDAEFPLASLALALGSIGGFTTWTLAVIHTEWLVIFNGLVVEFFQDLRFDLLDPVFLALTLAGDTLVLGAGFVLFSAALFLSGHKAGAAHMVAGGIVAGVLTVALKYGLFLARPETVDLPPVTPAYPSGHSSGATALYGLIATFIAQEFRHEKRWQIYTVAAIPIILVALSRLYLGVHWFSDVVGGILLGLMICGFIRCSFSRYDWLRLPLRGTFMAALGIWILLALTYIAAEWESAIERYAPLVIVGQHSETGSFHLLDDRMENAEAFKRVGQFNQALLLVLVNGQQLSQAPAHISRVSIIDLHT